MSKPDLETHAVATGTLHPQTEQAIVRDLLLQRVPTNPSDTKAVILRQALNRQYSEQPDSSDYLGIAQSHLF